MIWKQIRDLIKEYKTYIKLRDDNNLKQPFFITKDKFLMHVHLGTACKDEK